MTTQGGGTTYQAAGIYNRGMPSLFMPGYTANKLFGISPEAITVEYTTDGGNTWTERTGISDRDKMKFFTGETLQTANSSVNSNVAYNMGSGNVHTADQIGAGMGVRITANLDVENRTGGRISCLMTYVLARSQHCTFIIDRYNINKAT